MTQEGSELTSVVLAQVKKLSDFYVQTEDYLSKGHLVYQEDRDMLPPRQDLVRCHSVVKFLGSL